MLGFGQRVVTSVSIFSLVSKMTSRLVLPGPTVRQIEEWGRRKQLLAFMVWKTQAQSATMRQYVVATNVLVERFSLAPWCAPLRRWLRLVHKGLKAVASYTLGQWFPYGRMSEGMLHRLRSRWQ